MSQTSMVKFSEINSEITLLFFIPQSCIAKFIILYQWSVTVYRIYHKGFVIIYLFPTNIYNRYHNITPNRHWKFKIINLKVIFTIFWKLLIELSHLPTNRNWNFSSVKEIIKSEFWVSVSLAYVPTYLYFTSINGPYSWWPP